MPAKPSFSHFLGAFGPRGNSREFFFDVLGSDGKSTEIQKKEKVHCLQNQFFHIFFGPMGLGETLANFFSTFWEVMGNPGNPEKEKVHCLQSQVFHIFFGPMDLGETLAIFFGDVL